GKSILTVRETEEGSSPPDKAFLMKGRELSSTRLFHALAQQGTDYFAVISSIREMIVSTALLASLFSIAVIYVWRFSYSPLIVESSSSGVMSSSGSTSENPCFWKDWAFRIWSPRLAAAGSGI